jgi:hypothetical protein
MTSLSPPASWPVPWPAPCSSVVSSMAIETRHLQRREKGGGEKGSGGKGKEREVMGVMILNEAPTSKQTVGQGSRESGR